MKDVGWPIILVIATVLGSIIGAIILGTTHVIGFNWLLLIWGCIMLGITIYFVWYGIRTRIILQKQYQQDITAMRSEYKDYMAAYREYVDQEIIRWNEREEINAK